MRPRISHITRSIAGLSVVAPADSTSMAAAFRATVDHDGPIYFRIGRGRDPQVYETVDFTLGKAIPHGVGADLTIIATGSMVHDSLAAAATLREDGHSVGVLDMHTIKPLDVEAIAAVRSPLILTVEEHNILGGLGGAVAEVLAEGGTGVRLVRHGIRDEYSLIGPPHTPLRALRTRRRGHRQRRALRSDSLRARPPKTAANQAWAA